jgi:RHS repeat-associated protein
MKAACGIGAEHQHPRYEDANQAERGLLLLLRACLGALSVFGGTISDVCGWHEHSRSVGRYNGCLRVDGWRRDGVGCADGGPERVCGRDDRGDRCAVRYYLADHLGTTTMELTSGGWPLYSGDFAPYGQEIIDGAVSSAPTDTSSNHYKFTGKERDAESGLDYFGARYYASSMGRWMSPDWADKPEAVPYSDLANPQSLNLYGYVNNNPLSKADPDGHCPPCEQVFEQDVAPALEQYGSQFINATIGLGTVALAKTSGLLDKAGDALAIGLKGMPASTIDGIPLPPVQTMSNSPLAQPGGAAPQGDDGKGKEGAQGKPISKSEVKNLEKNTGQSAHDIKKDALGTNKNISKHDIHKNSDGNLTVKPKGSSGKGEDTGYTTDHLKKQ